MPPAINYTGRIASLLCTKRPIMSSKHTRLDRFISIRTEIKRRDVRLALAQGRIEVDGIPAGSINQRVGKFSHITLDKQVLQANMPLYLMMNKPCGVVSATRDEKHNTVMGLLKNVDLSGLHIAGRLDFSSTGLLLLTNDGRWSRRLSEPRTNIAKSYRVVLEKPISEEYISAFAKGMYFPYEGITTRPAELKIINDFVAEVRLVEGRYHQIKRMFGRFRNPVLKLHRFAIGALVLDPNLVAGQSRALTGFEVSNIEGGEGC